MIYTGISQLNNHQETMDIVPTLVIDLQVLYVLGIHIYIYIQNVYHTYIGIS